MDFTNLALKPAGKLFFALLFIGVLYVAKRCDDLFDYNLKSVRIDLSTCSEPIFLHKIYWGITTTNQRITISHSSSSPALDPDTTSNYVFRIFEPFYYRIEGDSLLVIYTPTPSSVPPEFECPNYIEQVEFPHPFTAKWFQHLDSLGVSEIE